MNGICICPILHFRKFWKHKRMNYFCRNYRNLKQVRGWGSGLGLWISHFVALTPRLQKTINASKTWRLSVWNLASINLTKWLRIKRARVLYSPKESNPMIRSRLVKVGQTKPVFLKKVKTTKKIVLRLNCVQPNCRCSRMLAIRDTSVFDLGGDKKRTGQY